MLDPSSTYPPKELEQFCSRELGERDYKVCASNTQEVHRSDRQNELIAPERNTLRAVMKLQGGVKVNESVEGYSGRRYYYGFDVSDVVQVQTIIPAQKLFSCPFVNVKLYSDAVSEWII